MARVLIVDDDPAYADTIEQQLGELGHVVTCAGCIEEGCEAARSERPDLVLLDVLLPDGNGLAAIDSIRQTQSEPEVIIVTGQGESDGAKLAIRSGAWTYVQKGARFQETLLAVRSALAYRKEKQAARTLCALDLSGIIGRSAKMIECYNLLAQAAASEVVVLLTGESGTGKELFARAIHDNGPRKGKPFVVVDCASLPENLVESMLLGHAKGSFTGATETRMGLVQQADGGTLFLDEIGELPFNLQKAFLRILQEHRFRPVGASKEVESDFRLVSASNRDLDQLVAEGRFREDLLFRLRSLVVHLPPLRERGSDAREIAKAHIARVCERDGVSVKGTSPDFLDVVDRHRWPGNVRELLLALERALATAADFHTLYPAHLPTEIRSAAVATGLERRTQKRTLRSWEEVSENNMPDLQKVRNSAEAEYLRAVLARTDFDVVRASAIANVARNTLYGLLKKHDIHRPT